MKKIKQIIFLSAIILFLGGCDKGFKTINTNPFEITDIDPALLFAGAERVGLGNGWESEKTIVQYFVNPYNLGATLGFNFNENIDGQQNGAWGNYTGSIKEFVHILHMDGIADRVNLQSMVRIWKAYVLMNMVDHYGNVPYFNVGLAAIEGEEYFYPAYDDASAIYDDLYSELKDAISKLNPSGDFVSADLFYGSNAYYPSSDAATQVAKWKKLGNSILLRLGMRYTKSNPSKAASIAAEAFNGGVMTSNMDNAFVVYDGTLYSNGANNGLITNNPRFYYAAEPFVNQLKSTNDPRSKYMVASFANPNEPLNDPNPDLDPANQYGVPVGIIDTELPRGNKGGGKNYSQMNVNVMASIAAPSFWLTYAQTALLLADAAKRGWIPGGDATAQQYYEAGVKADMDIYALYLSETGSGLPAVSAAEKDAYLAQDGVAYNSATALTQINTQYWIVNIIAGYESWANIRRTGIPALNRNTFNDELLRNGGDGYVHRFTYPDSELSDDKANYQDAIAKLNGGKDDLVSRVFWDTP